MEAYEFLVPGSPASSQTKDRAARRRWKEKVQAAAIRAAPEIPAFWDPGVRLTIVQLYTETEIDVDNVIKPIQDGLEWAFYLDDEVVTDVDAHRRWLEEDFDPVQLPEMLQRAWSARQECVYIRVTSGTALHHLL